MSLRLGHLNYLNAIPFYYPLLNKIIPFTATLMPGVPADLNHALYQGIVDLSLISSYEFLCHQDRYVLLPNFCIAAYQKVMSVTLYMREDLSPQDLEGQTVALTPQSASSAQLVKILCQHLWKVSPNFATLPSLKCCSQYPAFLMIGDQALLHQTFPHYTSIDLAEAWDALTQLPMTFAVFAARKEVWEFQRDEVMELQQQIAKALAWSQNHLSTIIKFAAQCSKLPIEILQQYYALLRYRLGEAELNGLQQYADLCHRELSFLCQTRMHYAK